MISICFTLKPFGALSLRPITRSLKTELIVFLHTTGKIFDEDLSYLNSILFFNVKIGSKMSSLKL